MPKRPVEFTITCAPFVKPTRVRVDESMMEGDELLNCRVGTTNVYKGTLQVDIVAPMVSLTAMCVGPANTVNTCNFKYKQKPFFTEDKELTERPKGKYRYYSASTNLPK